MTTVTLTPASTSPWTAPSGVTSVEVQCWGEGGNGGSSISGAHSGGGGGGGEFAQETSVAVTPGNTYVFSMGSGGTSTNTVFTGDSQTVTAHAGGNATGATLGSAGTGSSNATHFSGGSGGSGVATASRGGGGGGGSAGASGAGGNGTSSGSTSGGTGGTAGSGGGTTGATGGSSTSTGVAGGSPGAGGGGGGDGSTHAGGGGGDGQIVLTYTASTVHSGTAPLDGEGTLTGTGAFAGHAVLSGSGSLSGAVTLFTGVSLTGSGTLQGSVIGTVLETITLSGSGTLGAAGAAAIFSQAPLSGSGTLSAFPTLKYTAPMSGTGTLSIIGTGGVVFASPGASTPYAFPGTSQVAVAPPGTSAWQYLGSLGAVTALTYSFVCPGGADKMSATVMVPATYRTSLFDPGWQVRITRGGHIVWTGKLDEPAPTTQGWTLTAVGDGNRGQDFVAIYSGTWPSGQPDDAVNEAISRGLPWVNPGIGTPSGAWFGQAVDSGAQTITALLNLICTRGGLTWYANSQPGGLPGTDLSVFPLPTVPNRILVCTQPVPRTLGGDTNTIYIRYQVTAASSSTSGSQTATYAVTSVQNAQSAAMHGEIETYVDLSSAGTLSAGAAQAVGNHVLAIYQRASFAGSFTASYGQLLNNGGTPIDPGTDQAGTMVRLILTDFGYGGEVTPGPLEFIVGSYSWDDFAQVATISAYQTLDTSLTGLLSMENTVLTPITQPS